MYRLFCLIDRQINQFQQKTNFRCPAGCFHCCFHQDVQTTIIEFFPLIYYFYYSGHDLDKIDSVLEKRQDRRCIFLDNNEINENKGHCLIYELRPLTCRLFGFSMYNNKQNQKAIFCCRQLKQYPSYQEAVGAINKGAILPNLSDCFFKLFALDPASIQSHFPINIALQKSIHALGHYLNYIPKDKIESLPLKNRILLKPEIFI